MIHINIPFDSSMEMEYINDSKLLSYSHFHLSPVTILWAWQVPLAAREAQTAAAVSWLKQWKIGGDPWDVIGLLVINVWLKQ